MRNRIISIFTLLFAFILLTSCSGETQDTTPSVVSSFISPPTFSEPAGFYSEGFTLEISGSEGMTVRYTVDGTEPTDNSPVYKEPIVISNRSAEPNDLSAITGISTTGDYIPDSPVSKGTVVRAAVFSNDGRRSETATATYFVGLDYGDTLVVSIVADRDGLFSYESGIFMLGKAFDDWKESVGSAISDYGEWQYMGNFSLKGDEWEREINIEFFDSGNLIHEQAAGMRVAGAATRTYMQKNLRITARERYGEKSFKFDLIPDNTKDGFPNSTVTKYRSFVLRNGGNDCDIGRIRDPFIQSCVTDCSFSTQNTRPAVAFINGEYWGVYTVTEDYNERYIEENYGVDKDNVAMIKIGLLEEGSENDLILFYDVQNFITSNDMSLDENYDIVCDKLDVVGFAQFCALHLYIGSHDGPFEYNNWRAWRAVSTSDAPYHDGKIRFMVYDTEFSLGIYDNGGNYTENTFETLKDNGSYCGTIFNSLMKNHEFYDLFIDEFLKMRNTRFSPANSEKVLNALYDDYKDIMPEHYSRFGPSWVTDTDRDTHFDWALECILKYVNGRYDTAPRLLCIYLGLDPDTSIVASDDGSVSLVY